MVSGSRMGAVGESLPRLGFYGAILVVVVLSGVRVLAGEVTVKLASPGIPITHEAGNGPSSFGVLGAVACVSADGRYCVFSSDADNLVPNDNNHAMDVFRYDRLTNTVALASVNAAGTGSGNGASNRPTISADGRRVAFDSYASDLDLRDSGTLSDVFVRDFTTNATQLVSVNSVGTASGNGSSQVPRICADGNRVAYQSSAYNLHPLDTNPNIDVFVRDLTTQTTYMASINNAGTGSGNDQSADAVLDQDGSRVAFESYASNLHALDSDSSMDVFVRDLATNTTYLVSIDSAGTGSGNGPSSNPVISADGIRVAFSGSAANLHPLDTDSGYDVFLRDLSSATTHLVSINAAGTSNGNGESLEPAISANGTQVAFASYASDLDPLDSDGMSDIFVRDVDLGETHLVSVNSSGTGSANLHCYRPTISSDGTHVGFYSNATNLKAGSGSNYNVFVRDTVLGTTALASVNSAGTSGGNGFSGDAVLSSNGAVAVFSSQASDLTALADGGGLEDIFVYDADTSTCALASAAYDFAPAVTSALGDCDTDGLPFFGATGPISADGRYMVFETEAGNLVANDTNNTFDIFRFDFQTGAVVLVSVNASGTGSGNDESRLPTISADGNRVAFHSSASNLLALDSNGIQDVFVRDIAAGVTYLASVNTAGTGPGSGSSYYASICQNGNRVAFASEAANLAASDTNARTDVFVRDLDAGVTYLASMNSAGTASANNSSLRASLNADGTRAAFVSFATDMHPLATVSALNAYVRDLSTNTTFLVNVNRFGTGASGGSSSNSMRPAISADGKRAAFSCTSNTVHALDTDTVEDVFVRDLDAGVTYLASTNTAGTGSGNLASKNPSISADGKRVAFETSATNLHPTATYSFYSSVMVRDLDTSTTYLASISPSGLNQGYGTCTNPTISADGTRVAFASTAINLHPKDTDSVADIFVRDLAKSKTYLASVAVSGTESGNVTSVKPAISSNGVGVAFGSYATNLSLLASNDGDVDAFLAHIGRSDLKVEVAESADPVTAGSGAGNLVYTVTVSNLGPADATGVSLDVETTLPQGVSLVSAIPSGSGTFDSGVWTVGDLDSGTSSTLAVTLTVASGATSGANLVGIDASLSAVAEGDMEDANNTAQATTSIVRSADLKVTISDSADPVTAGSGVGNLVYTATVENLGPSDATGVSLTVSRVLPTGAALVGFVAGGSTSYSAGTWTVGTLVSGASKTLTATITVGPTAVPATNSVHLQAQIASVNEPDSNSGNNSDLEYTSVVRSADIAVSITESADPVTAGSGTQNLVYTVTAKNLGPSNASGLTLAISPTLPSGVSVSGIVCSGTTSYSAGTWTIGTLTRNASVTLTGTLTVGSSALSGTDVVNLQAQVSNLNEADPNPGNDADIEATSVVRSVDLAVGVSDSADPTALTDSPVVLVYTLTVSNLGPSSASGVALDVATTLPAGVTVGSSLAGGGSTFDGSTWTVGNLASGASQTLAITLSLAPAVKPGTDVVSLQAQVTGVNEPDSNVGNDVASEATSVVHSVDLAVEVAESADPVVLGAASVELVYTVTVSNLGPFDASGVSLDIATTLPSKSVLNSSVPSGSTSFDGSTWNVGAIASASSETLALHITVAADEVAGADVISVQASVAAVAEHDAVSENDSSSEATSVVHLADLVLTKDDDGLLAAPDKVTVYAIAVLNQGPNSADGVVITETVPAGTVYWAAESDAGWNVTGGGVAGDTCTFNVGSLSVGASKEVAFAVKVVNPLSGVSVEIENTATVDSASNEANPGDELDTVNTFLVPNPIDDIDGDDIPNAEDPDDDGDGIPDTKDPDRDGDGIDNLLDPNLDDPTEVGPTGIPGLEGMTWSKALGTLNFVAPGKDSFKASGVLLLPAAFVLEGATAEVDIGGEMRSFLLSDKGKGESGSDKIKVKIKPTKPVSSQVNAKVVLGLSKGDLVMGDIDGVPFDGSTLGTAARDLQLVLTLDDGNLAPQSRYNQKRVEYKVTDKKGVLKSLKP